MGSTLSLAACSRPAAGLALWALLITMAGAQSVDVIEYYDLSLDHYFMTSLPVEINALDAGQGWARTGLGFGAFPQPVGAASPVCRFYIPPAYGDSHFYSASPSECAITQAKYPFFVAESPNVMYVDLPDPITGACPSGDVSVYRMWDARADTNHRYTTDPAIRAQMVAKGWIAEGYGPDQVIMCAPMPAAARRMAFVRRQGSVNHINFMDVDAAGVGGNPTRLTTDGEAEDYPSWSPDGKRLVYQRSFNGSAIYAINADGTGQQRLSPTPGFDVTPSWSPDGTKIVYARLLALPQPNEPPLTDIRVMNADGTGDHAVLANSVFSVEPRWSINDQLVFMSNMHGSELQIYVMNVDGTGLRQLTTAANNGDPVWSPDGTRITFGSDREGGNKLNVFVMNADGSEQMQLTHFDVPYEAGDTNWSSDEKKITFEYDINGMKQSDPNAYAEVWTMNSDGSGASSTGVQCSGVGCAPRWQPR
jgi:Tol biopolymer transport system component